MSGVEFAVSCVWFLGAACLVGLIRFFCVWLLVFYFSVLVFVFGVGSVVVGLGVLTRVCFGCFPILDCWLWAFEFLVFVVLGFGFLNLLLRVLGLCSFGFARFAFALFGFWFWVCGLVSFFFGFGRLVVGFCLLWLFGVLFVLLWFLCLMSCVLCCVCVCVVFGVWCCFRFWRQVLCCGFSRAFFGFGLGLFLWMCFVALFGFYFLGCLVLGVTCLFFWLWVLCLLFSGCRFFCVLCSVSGVWLLVVWFVFVFVLFRLLCVCFFDCGVRLRICCCGCWVVGCRLCGV